MCGGKNAEQDADTHYKTRIGIGDTYREEQRYIALRMKESRDMLEEFIKAHEE